MDDPSHSARHERAHIDSRGSTDAALARLEDVLGGYPYDRALPDLQTILSEADVDRDLLREDDRAVKLLHEAIVSRPLSTLDAVSQAQTEVELLTLEVAVLSERLTDPETPPEAVGRAAARLDEIRETLEELRRRL